MQPVDDEKESKRLLESLFSAYIRIAKLNQNRALSFPFGTVSIESDDIQRIREWTRGLLRAIGVRPTVWGLTGKVGKSSNVATEMSACAAIVIGIAFPEEIPNLFPAALVKGIPLGSTPEEIEAKLFALLPIAAASILEYANASRAGLRPLGAGKASSSPETHQAVKIGRNDPCPCGSGLKYKKCCGK
jgi:uncharacterized protein YecA (UPF0149 family)